MSEKDGKNFIEEIGDIKVQDRRIHRDEEIERRFLQVDFLLLENPKYKKLSGDTILAYALLRNRLDLSKKNAEVYSDEEGYLFLTYTDEELAEILRITRQTANARKKELEKFGLIFMKRMGKQKPNRIYICKPEICSPEQYISAQYRERKKKELEAKEEERRKLQAEQLKLEMLEKQARQETIEQKAIEEEILAQEEFRQQLLEKQATQDVDPDEFEIDEEAFQEFVDIFSQMHGWDIEAFPEIRNEMIKQKLGFFTINEAFKQMKRMDSYGTEKINYYPAYFVGGIIKNRTSKKRAIIEDEAIKSAQKRRENEVQQPRQEVVFYNWLGEN